MNLKKDSRTRRLEVPLVKNLSRFDIRKYKLSTDCVNASSVNVSIHEKK